MNIFIIIIIIITIIIILLYFKWTAISPNFGEK